MCYDSVCRRITAVWQSFGHTANTQRLRINRSATLDTDSSSSPPDATGALLEAVRVLTTTLQNAGSGGPRPGSAKNVSFSDTSDTSKEPKKTPLKETRLCLNEACGDPFSGFSYQQICKACFETIKADRKPLTLKGSREGKDFTGKTLSCVDSTNPKHQSRGGWKMKIHAVRVFGIFPNHFSTDGSACRINHDTRDHQLVVLTQSLKSLQDAIPTCHYPPLFWGADSCAGVGASGVDEIFHGPITPLSWVIEGIASGNDSLVSVEGSGTAIFMVQDRVSGTDIILKYGGMLKCPSNAVSSSVGSSSQVGNYFNASNGSSGARFHTADPDNACIELPGGASVALHVNDDGAFGCLITPLHPTDPRLISTPSVWISKDCVYKPPRRSGSVPVRINGVVARLQLPTTDADNPVIFQDKIFPDLLVDEDVHDSASNAVEDVLSDPALGKYSYKELLSGTASDLAIGQCIFAGYSAKAILKTLSHSWVGKLIFDTDGLSALEDFNTTHSHPAASMKKHKKRLNAKVDREQIRPRVPPGKHLETDTCHTLFHIKGLPKYFQLFRDKAVAVGSCYAMYDKTGESYLSCAQEHIAHFAPDTVQINSDGARELTQGVAGRWFHYQRIKVHSAVPHTYTNPIEIKFVRQFSTVTTHMMLDSQLPQRFTELVGKMACIVISFMHIRFEDRDTTSFFEVFKKEPDLRMLKRVGCECFFLLNKVDRVRFGSTGVRGVFIGLAIHTHPDWTFIVWSPVTGNLYFRRDVLFNQNSMPFRDARRLISGPDGCPLLRRSIADFTRSDFRDDVAEYDLGISGEVEQHLCNLHVTFM